MAIHTWSHSNIRRSRSLEYISMSTVFARTMGKEKNENAAFLCFKEVGHSRWKAEMECSPYQLCLLLLSKYDSPIGGSTSLETSLISGWPERKLKSTWVERQILYISRVYILLSESFPIRCLFGKFQRVKMFRRIAMTLTKKRLARMLR